MAPTASWPRQWRWAPERVKQAGPLVQLEVTTSPLPPMSCSRFLVAATLRGTPTQGGDGGAPCWGQLGAGPPVVSCGHPSILWIVDVWMFRGQVAGRSTGHCDGEPALR